MKKYLIVIAGPTAIGKTSTAISLAHEYQCPILSADSRQIYKEMEIGTAKPTTIELQAAKHYFINHISIDQHYSAGQFEKDCIKSLNDIYIKSNVAILCGGTGLYIDAVLNGLDEFPPIDPQFKTLLEQKKLQELQAMLREQDPSYAATVDMMNSRRIVRALAVIKASGKPFSSYLSSKKKNRPFIPILLHLTMDRDLLYNRINNRVDLMIKSGLLAEAQSLSERLPLKALDTVGYKELFEYLSGDQTESRLTLAIELIKRNSRRYAKRQLTWYRNKPGWTHFDINEIESIKSFIAQNMIK